MEAIAPTVEAIEAWRAKEQRPHKAGEPIYGVNVRTKTGSWRCVTSRVDGHGYVWYWTIRAEGKSSAGRETPIRADQIVMAQGWVVA